MRIVPAFDELKNSQACLRWGMEGVAVEQLTFQRGEETLTQGIIVAISDGAHRRSDAGFPTALTEGQGSVLAALIGMMDDTPGTTLAFGLDTQYILVWYASLGPGNDAVRLNTLNRDSARYGTHKKNRRTWLMLANAGFDAQ